MSDQKNDQRVQGPMVSAGSHWRESPGPEIRHEHDLATQETAQLSSARATSLERGVCRVLAILAKLMTLTFCSPRSIAPM